jgi:hypothetical protein
VATLLGCPLKIAFKISAGLQGSKRRRCAYLSKHAGLRLNMDGSDVANAVACSIHANDAQVKTSTFAGVVHKFMMRCRSAESADSADENMTKLKPVIVKPEPGTSPAKPLGGADGNASDIEMLDATDALVKPDPDRAPLAAADPNAMAPADDATMDAAAIVKPDPAAEDKPVGQPDEDDMAQHEQHDEQRPDVKPPAPEPDYEGEGFKVGAGDDEQDIDDDEDFEDRPAGAVKGEAAGGNAEARAPAATPLAPMADVQLPEDEAQRQLYIERAFMGISNVMSDCTLACRAIHMALKPPLCTHPDLFVVDCRLQCFDHPGSCCITGCPGRFVVD